jgi:alkaline phosphatase D
MLVAASLLLFFLADFAGATAAEPGKLAAGPMLANGNHHDVTIWLRTLEPAEVAIRYWPRGDPRKTQQVLKKTAGEDGRILSVTLKKLTAGRQYTYTVSVDDVIVETSNPLRFKTQTLWRRRGDPPEFTIAVGSCAYTNDPATEPPGPQYGGGYEIYESIRAQSPEVMLWLGDNVYLRPFDWSSRTGIFARYAQTRALKEVQPLLASTYNYAIWDDHDYGPNDSNWSFVHKSDSLAAFKAYWPNPSFGMRGHPGVFTQFTWGDVDLFLLDNRFYRSASSAPDGPDKTMLGEVQMRWLLDALSGSRAPFKIVAGGGQFLSPFHRWEGYAQFKTEQQRLIDAIVERRLNGVVFVSGDRHHSELVKLEPKGFYPLYDFTSSPLTSRGASADGEWKSPVRVPGTLVTQKRSFGLLKFSGPAKDRVLTLENRDVGGALLWARTIRAKELSIVATPDH